MEQKLLMIKNYIDSLRGITCSLLTLSLILLTSCTQEEGPGRPSAPAKDAHLELPVTLDIASGMTAPEARVIITERPAKPSQAKGIDFGWKKDDVIEPVYVHLTQGTTKTVVEGKITILENLTGSGTYKAKLSVDFPASIKTKVKQGQFEGGEITMAAAFGVDKVSDDGIAEVAEREAFFEGEAEDNPPMYTAASPLTLKVDEDTHELVPQWGGTFRLFGLFLRLRIENKSNMRYSPVLLSIKEGAFESSASFDIRTGEKTEGQAASTAKGVKAGFKARFVPSKTTKSFYIWAYGLNKRAKSAAYLYSSASYPEPDVKKNITLTAAPENGKVYDLPLKPVPQNGDLIFSEVGIYEPRVYGDGRYLYAHSIELYNPTDEPIDLRLYTLIGSFCRPNSWAGQNDPTFGYSLASEFYNVDSHLLPYLARYNYNYLIWPKVKENDLPKNDLHILPPHGTAVFSSFSRSFFIQAANMDTYPGLHFANDNPANSRRHNKDSKEDAFKGFRFWLRKKVEGKDEVLVDAVLDSGPVPSQVTLMRKPGRDIPRKKMRITDWVTRMLAPFDLGRRFGYYYDASREGSKYHGVCWIVDGSQGYSDRYTGYDKADFIDGGLMPSPLLQRTSYRYSDNYSNPSMRDRAPYYTPPKWWTKEMAEAADRP